MVFLDLIRGEIIQKNPVEAMAESEIVAHHLETPLSEYPFNNDHLRSQQI